MAEAILVHETDDDVGVATADLSAGSVVGAVTLDGAPVAEIELVDEVPLSHKVALRDLAADAEVVEYGRAIGRTTTAVGRGAHVHTHNLRSQRWAGRSQIVDHTETAR